jgi:hypothetical protein
MFKRGLNYLGSRIMHLIIGNKIAEILSIEDKTSFLIGSIAPDAVFSNEEKNKSHFFIGDVKDYTRSVDYKGFLDKYSPREGCTNPYLMGYYTHLIADDIWLKGFYLFWLKNRMGADDGLYNLYHNDFRLLNGKLLEYYGFTEEFRKILSQCPTILDLEEVNSDDVEKYVPYALEDLDYNKAAIKEQLNVFTFNQIIGYIETAVELGLLNTKPFLT